MKNRTMEQSERGKKRIFFFFRYFPFLRCAMKCRLFFGVTKSVKFANFDGFSQKCCLKNDKTLFVLFFFQKGKGSTYF